MLVTGAPPPADRFAASAKQCRKLGEVRTEEALQIAPKYSWLLLASLLTLILMKATQKLAGRNRNQGSSAQLAHDWTNLGLRPCTLCV
jgi:hypothetical protein